MCLVTGLDLKEDQQESVLETNYDDWEDEDEDEEEDISDFSTIKVDNFIKFFTSHRESAAIVAFRQRMNRLIARFLSEKNFKHSILENDLVDVVADVLAKEDVKSPNIDVNATESFEKIQAQQSRNQGGRGESSNWRQKPSGSGNGQRNQYQNTQQSWKRQEGNQFSNRESRRREQAHYEQNVWGQGSSQQPQSRNVPFKSRDNKPKEKYFVLKMNNQKLLGKMTANTLVNIEELNLKVWQFHKIRSVMQSGTHVYIILFSTTTKHFLGYGNVGKIVANQPVFFHFRCSHYLPLSGLGLTKFAQDIAHPLSQQSFQFHDLDAVAGRSLVAFFQSD